jgi:hypothetical protein
VLHRPIDLLVILRTNRLRKLLPYALPQQLLLGTAPKFLCTPVHVGETPITIYGVEGVAYPLENLDNLSLVDSMQDTLMVRFGRV